MVTLVIHVLHGRIGETEREFIVEALCVDTLRCSEALIDYIDDVREQLENRNVRFATSGWARRRC